VHRHSGHCGEILPLGAVAGRQRAELARLSDESERAEQSIEVDRRRRSSSSRRRSSRRRRRRRRMRSIVLLLYNSIAQ
jgi:hypothetical protein